MAYFKMVMSQTLTAEIRKAATIIKAGGVVAFPTETYYGLAVDPFNRVALEKIYKLKKRQHSKPLLTLIADSTDLDILVESIPDGLRPFMKLWPAPLTLIFPGLPSLSEQLTGGTGTIGVRISSHPVATALVKACGFPITATSANLSGETACQNSNMIHVQFSNTLDYVLDGGQTLGGKGSTLVSLQNGIPVVLRDGALPSSMLENLR